MRFGIACFVYGLLRLYEIIQDVVYSCEDAKWRQWREEQMRNAVVPIHQYRNIQVNTEQVQYDDAQPFWEPSERLEKGVSNDCQSR